MTPIRLSLSVLSVLSLLCFADPSLRAADAGLKKGKPDIQSAGPLAFGPEGILFAADPWGAAVFAIDTGDKGPREKGAIKVEKLDSQAAALLGTTPAELEIQDIAVNPASGNVYVSASRGRGPEAKPAIIKVSRDGKLSLVALDDIAFSKAAIPNAPSPEAKSKRGDRPRLETITDIALVDGKVLVAGLSNEEFASTFRSIPFPFTGDAKGTSVEIYHGAHGNFETRSPVRTFVPFEFGGEMHLLAAYTCTPLVKFSLKELKPGTHLKGTTIAELGNQNRPLDMIVYRKDGKDFLLLANNNRGVMKITTEGIDKAEPILTAVRGGGKKGMTYETIDSWKGTYQLDRYDDANALVLRKDDKTGSFHMESLPLP
jgi:hypothetical protein